MNVEKVLEYLGECLSCESRILSLEKMKEKLKEIQNNEYEENKEYERIINGEVLKHSSLHIPEYEFEKLPLNLKELYNKILNDVRYHYRKCSTDNYLIGNNYGNIDFSNNWEYGFKRLVGSQIAFLNSRDNTLISNVYKADSIAGNERTLISLFNLPNPFEYQRGFRKLRRITGDDVCLEVLRKDKREIDDFVNGICSIYKKYIKSSFEKNYYEYSISKPILNNKIKQLDDEIVKTKEILNDLYGLNIIHAKYQDIIAVSSFIDYLSSGRCNGFEGADGCYNLFESESRQDKIINQLTEITSLLKDIKQQQYALYCVLNEINTRVENISSDFIDFKNSYRNHSDEIINSLESIKKSNTAIAFETSLSNRLLEISNENQNAIIQNQKFEQLLYTEPSIFGARQITAKALSKYR